MTRDRRESGFAAIEFVAGLALLVAPMIVIVLALPGWFDRQALARTVARELAREAVLDGSCDPIDARARVAEIASNVGVDPADVSFTFRCGAAAPGLTRDGNVTVEVSIRIPDIPVPGLGAVSGGVATAGHTEPVDRYRSAG